MATILLVDDEADLLVVLSTLMEMHGYSVATAADGSRALEVAEKQPVDLVLTDLMMPVMDGLELCRRLRAGAATRHIPIILNSAGAAEPEGAGVLFDVFMQKPAAFQDQLQQIERLLPAAR